MSGSSALQAWRHRARDDGHRPRRPPARAVLAATAVAAVGFSIFGGFSLNGESEAAPTPPATAGQPVCPAVATVLHADIDGDGCDEAVTFADGVLTAGSTRMRVGARSDQIALGRWTCGAATVSLLRPSTGEVFRFDGWATQGNPVAAVASGRVEGALSLEAAARNGGRCDDLVVIRASGPPVLLPERPVAG